MLGSGSGSGGQHYLINHKYVHETSDVKYSISQEEGKQTTMGSESIHEDNFKAYENLDNDYSFGAEK